MASIELRDVTGLSGDEGPPIYRPSGSIRNLAGGCTRSGRDYNLAATEDPDSAREEQLPPPSLDVPLNRLLAFLLRFFSANKLNLLLLSNVLVHLSGLSTLTIVAELLHGQNSRPPAGMPSIICGGNANETCTITTNILPSLPTFDPDDLDAVALHELTKRELFRVVKRAVRDVFLKPGNESSVFQILVGEMTAYMEPRQQRNDKRGEVDEEVVDSGSD